MTARRTADRTTPTRSASVGAARRRPTGPSSRPSSATAGGPYGAIAEEVGLSEAAVRRRVQRLRESGIIQIVAVTDPLQLGFHRQAMVGIRVEGDVRRVAAKLAALDEVDYVVMCAGSFDLLAEVVCEDDDRLLHLLNDSIRSIPGVPATETFLYLKLAKQTYTWGTR